MNNAVVERIDVIASIFRAGQAIAEAGSDPKAMVARLEEMDIGFRSVAYEGAAMALINSKLRVGLINKEELNGSLAVAPAYRDHLLIGFGWALAASQTDLQLATTAFDPLEEAKILDGSGYYHGLFRKRLFVLGQAIPSELSAERLPLFDKGIGRAMWYVTKGDIGKVINLMEPFPQERKKALWIGVGLACTFVGGMSEADFKAVGQETGQFITEFHTGAILAYLGRIPTGSVDEFAQVYCNSILGKGANDILKKLEEGAYVDQAELIETIGSYLH